METIRLIGRNSRLSLLQMEIVKRKIEQAFPAIDVQVIGRSSRGDALQEIPLHTVEGSDFFTQDIFDSLTRHEADIAVHSLKDMSSEHFFGENHFAVVDRNDVRDISIFHARVMEKIIQGEDIIIGTCSPRREQMAVGFLQKALPQLNNFRVVTKVIRGNVDTRLRKLDRGEYDGIILATAGLNRLLDSNGDAGIIRELLHDKKMMLLPLIECVPAPCQGAIVAETIKENARAIEILHAINDPALLEECRLEKMTAKQYGIGCLQRFGVTTLAFGTAKIIYAAGCDSEGTTFSKWTGLPEVEIKSGPLFSTTDLMGKFFRYEDHNDGSNISESIVYTANYKAVQRSSLIGQLKMKRNWASGTKTWLELAKAGIWVEGSADAIGLNSLIAVWKMPLIGIDKKEVGVITNAQSVSIWQSQGWNVYATYSLADNFSEKIAKEISEAGLIFWTSFRQYLQYKDYVNSNTRHSCSFGETAEQFKSAGIDPVIFPTIKAFQQWRQTSIPLRSAV